MQIINLFDKEKRHQFYNEFDMIANSFPLFVSDEKACLMFSEGPLLRRILRLRPDPSRDGVHELRKHGNNDRSGKLMPVSLGKAAQTPHPRACHFTICMACKSNLLIFLILIFFL